MSGPAESVTVTLGEVELRACPQPHAYLLHELERVLGDAFSETRSEAEFFTGLREGMYDALNVFLGGELKRRLPPWEFHGYATREAWVAREYDVESARRSPTVPEIADAFDTCVALNGDSFLSKLFQVVDPKVIRAVISDRLLDTLSTISLSLPGENGESAQTSSGDAPPTSPDGDSSETETLPGGNGSIPQTSDSPSLASVNS